MTDSDRTTLTPRKGGAKAGARAPQRGPMRGPSRRGVATAAPPVVVQKKRRRAPTPSAATEATTPSLAPPSAREKRRPPAPPRRDEKGEKTAAPPKRSKGVVLRPLSDREREARAKALTEAQKREEEDRRKVEQEVAEAAEKEKARLAEREQAARREEAREAQRQREAKARAEAAQVAEKRLQPAHEAPAGEALVEEEEARGGGAKPKGARRPERRRREGKLTVAKALDENERQFSMAALRRRRQRQRLGAPAQPVAPVSRDVVIPETITVAELSARMARRTSEVIRALMQQGIMAKVTDILDADTAQLVAEEFKHNVRRIADSDVENAIDSRPETEEEREPRPPVVTVMGHVDHGKTSLLDAFRQRAVAKSEAAGITQHIAAYRWKGKGGRSITFIDTPGHAAFTAMRARGARTTDIVILVVAADDGVMPQTEEAIAHAKAAETPLVVAITKTDLPHADIEKTKQSLMKAGVILEDMGGEILFASVSALKGEGLEALEEAILLQADLMDLRAAPSRAARGVVLESSIRKGFGPVATFLVQRGTLKKGDAVIVGTKWGRARALSDENGKALKEAGLSVPCEVAGLNGVPEAGSHFDVTPSEAEARSIAEYRASRERDLKMAPRQTDKTSPEDIFASLTEKSEKPRFSILLKTDVQGSAAALESAARALSDEIEIHVVMAAVGEITESDVMLAETTSADILGFNVPTAKGARDAAKRSGTVIHSAPVIYDLVESLGARMSRLLAPSRREVSLGRATVLKVFEIARNRRAAGCLVEEGSLRKPMRFRLLRGETTLYEGALDSLRRFKDNVDEVRAGQECGLGFSAFQELEEGDIVECFRVEEAERRI